MKTNIGHIVAGNSPASSIELIQHSTDPVYYYIIRYYYNKQQPQAETREENGTAVKTESHKGETSRQQDPTNVIHLIN